MRTRMSDPRGRVSWTLAASAHQSDTDHGTWLSRGTTRTRTRPFCTFVRVWPMSIRGVQIAVYGGAAGPVAGTRHVTVAGGALSRLRCRAKNRTALSDSNLGSSLCLPALACNVFSFEAKASNSARPDWRGMCSSSHWR
jgi:hypothetical protein